VITKNYNHMKNDPSSPLCTVPSTGCDALDGPFGCATYVYPAKPSGTPDYCTYQYSCADDTQVVSDALDWVSSLIVNSAPKFLMGFSNGAQLSMSIACDARLVNKVDAVISQHGTPSGNYCCWDNPNSPPPRQSHRLKGFFTHRRSRWCRRHLAHILRYTR